MDESRTNLINKDNEIDQIKIQLSSINSKLAYENQLKEAFKKALEEQKAKFAELESQVKMFCWFLALNLF